ncbi:uncharacterized protein LOC113306437 [Papaver somniferum]|uniref:uncharacterized protein LOC113306437 n=1 Tax=Papaver somniferum TaxID=3469 RepID=UPI000E6F7F04|nr:uncharacterized protein LOC113306437 [Papaver somniferum]
MGEFPWKQFWKQIKILPKIQNFVWKVLQDGIAVYENLRKYNPSVQITCPMCGTTEESVLHLFFNCQFALEVYHASTILIETQGNSVMDIISHWLEYPDQGIMLNLGGCLLWNIWKTKNDLVFSNIQIAFGPCIRKSLEDALNFCSEIQVNQFDTAVWELPPSTFVKINVDAAYSDGKGAVAAVRWILLVIIWDVEHYVLIHSLQQWQK